MGLCLQSSCGRLDRDCVCAMMVGAGCMRFAIMVDRVYGIMFAVKMVRGVSLKFFFIGGGRSFI